MALALTALAACATPPSPALMTAQDAAINAPRAADDAERNLYEQVAESTADGSRAYRYRWAASSAGGPGGWAALIVTADGHGRLMGSIPQTVDLDAGALVALERDAAATEFPDFPHVLDEGICMDGRVNSFDMARGGQHRTAFSNACGAFGENVGRVAQDLRALAQANGGITLLPREMGAVPVKVIDASDLEN
ncbi:MAG: hypothetical protein JWP35_2777 [Caulobacter sp.]|nr:hypothetical protein [Caulobacter sp.]